VKHLHQTYPTREVRKVYFFCRSNDRASILADTILRSLLRQCLDSSSLPTYIESDLVKLLRHTWVDPSALCAVLRSAMSRYHTVYMIIDGIDECETPQRSVVLESLSKLSNSSVTIVKLVVASRNTVSRLLTTSSIQNLNIDIRQGQFQDDISTFIDDSFTTRLHNGISCDGVGHDGIGPDNALYVRDFHVVIEVREALLSGAKGM
jgi:hypothetical protein